MGLRYLRRSMKKKNNTMNKEEFIVAWLMHFGHADLYPGQGVSCEKCLDYLDGSCEGGHNPEKCMVEKSSKLEFIE